MIIMTSLFENIPYTYCMTFCYPFFIFSQYNITCSIFHQGFAYHSETHIIIRERERKRERKDSIVCVWERKREREKERERILRPLQVISFLTLIEWEICLYLCIIFQRMHVYFSDMLAVPVDFISNDVIKMFSVHIIVTRWNGLQFK